MTLSEVREQLLAALPPGMPQRLGPDLRAYYEGIAEVLKTWCADIVDRLRREANPRTCEQMLSRWEAALALTETTVAKFGTTAQRQRQVIAKLRERGSLSIPDIRAVMQMFFLYADPSAIQVLETSRSALKALHTHAASGLPAAITVFPGLAVTWDITKDVGDVSEAGAQVQINITGQLEDLMFELVGPLGSTQKATWDEGYLGTGAVVAQSYMLYAPRDKVFGVPPNTWSIAGPIYGRWTLKALRTGIPLATLHSASLFVEGIGRVPGGEGLGAAMYEFAVVADGALLGSGYDLNAAYDALQRIKPAWSVARMAMGGGLLAIPDLPETLPDASIPA